MVAPSRGIYLHFKTDVTIFTVLKRLLKYTWAALSIIFSVVVFYQHMILDSFLPFCLLSLILQCRHYLLSVSPAAPAAALAALQRPSVATVGAAVAASRAAPSRASHPIEEVLVTGSSPALGRRQLAG